MLNIPPCPHLPWNIFKITITLLLIVAFSSPLRVLPEKDVQILYGCLCSCGAVFIIINFFHLHILPESLTMLQLCLKSDGSSTKRNLFCDLRLFQWEPLTLCFAKIPRNLCGHAILAECVGIGREFFLLGSILIMLIGSHCGCKVMLYLLKCKWQNATCRTPHYLSASSIMINFLLLFFCFLDCYLHQGSSGYVLSRSL